MSMTKKKFGKYMREIIIACDIHADYVAEFHSSHVLPIAHQFAMTEVRLSLMRNPMRKHLFPIVEGRMKYGFR